MSLLCARAAAENAAIAKIITIALNRILPPEILGPLDLVFLNSEQTAEATFGQRNREALPREATPDALPLSQY